MPANTLSKIGDFLIELPDAELRDILKSLNASDDLSLQLIQKIAGPHSPMPISDLPFLNFPRGPTLVKLYHLQSLGILKSSLVKKGNDYVRVFEKTPLTQRIRRMPQE